MNKPVIITPAELAPLGKRFVNYLIDFIACTILMMACYFLCAYLSETYGIEGLAMGMPVAGNIKFTLLSTAVNIAYYGLFESLLALTPGKYVTDTRVVMRDGSVPGNDAILLRTLTRIIPLEFISFFGVLPIGWHDMFSKTLVVDNYAFEKAARKANEVAKTTDEL